MKAKRILWILTALLVLIGIVLPVAAIVLAVQSRPLVVQVEQLTPERARQARDLASRMAAEFLYAEQPTGVVLGKDELNGLMVLAARTIPRLQGRVNITQSHVLTELTVTLPTSPLGRYLNLVIVVDPSDNGLDIEQVRIGSMALPGAIAVPLARLTLNIALGDHNGSVMLDMVRSLSIESNQIIVRFHPVPDFQVRLDSIRQRLELFRDEAALLGDPALVRFYYREIMQRAELVDPGQEVSLAAYMSPLFHAAQERSRTSSAVDENRAAILALAIYFGSTHFEVLTGTVRTKAMRQHESRAGRTTLAHRQDLRLHFIYSAALKLASDSGVSFALGEFKELLDSAPKGSGFSFVDLAADRAGVWFAQMAVRDEGSASRLQALLANSPSETSFFPAISDLPEHLSQRAFEREYGSVDSPIYHATVEGIGRRLRQLPLYRAEAEFPSY